MKAFERLIYLLNTELPILDDSLSMVLSKSFEVEVNNVLLPMLLHLLLLLESHCKFVQPAQPLLIPFEFKSVFRQTNLILEIKHVKG